MHLLSIYLLSIIYLSTIYYRTSLSIFVIKHESAYLAWVDVRKIDVYGPNLGQQAQIILLCTNL